MKLAIFFRLSRFTLSFLILFTLTLLLITFSLLEKNRSIHQTLTAERANSIANIFERAFLANSHGRRFFQLQEMAEEFALTRDLLFITLVDGTGKIFAHSDPSLVGTIFSLQDKIEESQKLYDSHTYWNIVGNERDMQFILYQEIKEQEDVQAIVYNEEIFPLDLSPAEKIFQIILDLIPHIGSFIDQKNKWHEKKPQNRQYLGRLQGPFFIYIGQDITSYHKRLHSTNLFLVIISIVILLVTFIFSLIIQHLVNNKEIQRRQEEKLNAIGDLTAGIAHEIRNPLSSLKGYATFFKQKFIIGSTEENIANIMIEEIDRLNRAVDDLVGLNRSFDIKPSEVNIIELCQKICLLIDPELQDKNIDFQCVYPQNISYKAMLDPDRFKQAVLNILLNAMEAFEKDCPKKRIVFEVIKKNKNLLIAITDNGVGIDDKILARIFDPYFTTKAQGTGLGLVIAKNIIDSHKGSLNINSIHTLDNEEIYSEKQETGTRVEIFIPLL